MKVKILEDVKGYSGEFYARRGDIGTVIQFYNSEKFGYALVKIGNRFAGVAIEWLEEVEK